MQRLIPNTWKFLNLSPGQMPFLSRSHSSAFPFCQKKLQLNLNDHKYLSPSNAELLTAMDLLGGPGRAGEQEGFAFGLPWKIYRVVGGITGIVIRGSNLLQMEVGLAGLLRAGDSS